MRTKNNYPKDRLYCVIPTEYKEEILDSLYTLPRENNTNTKFIWDFPSGDSILDIIKDIEGAKILTYSEMLSELQKDEWQPQDLLS